MKKRLLTLSLGMMCALAGFAYEVGDVVFTSDARVRIIGDNIVVNGNFANAFDGWHGATMADEPNAETWSFEEFMGPNGENVLKSLNTNDNLLSNKWLFEDPGTYVVTFQAKTDAAYTNTKVANAGWNNYVNFMLTNPDNVDEAGNVVSTSVAAARTIGNEWTTLAFAFNAEQGDTLTMNINRMATGVMFTNFEIHPAQLEYDTRILEDIIRNFDSLQKTGEFQDPNGEIDAIIDYFRGIVETGEGAEDIEGLTGTVATDYATAFNRYLNSNSADLFASGVIQGQITGLPSWNAGNFSNGAYPDWVADGENLGRWAHRTATSKEFLTYEFGGGGYTLTPSSMFIQKAGLPAGKYLLTLQVNGNRYAGRENSDSYVTIFTQPIEGCQVFIGNDSITCQPLKPYSNQWDTYSIVAELAEGDTLRAGFHFVGISGGGICRVKNFVIRQVGIDENTVAYNNEVEKIIAQEQALKERLDAAREDVLKTKADGYPWGHDALKEATAQYQEAYDGYLAQYVNANGEVVGRDAIWEALFDDALTKISDVIMNDVRAMNTARNTFESLNKHYQDLLAQIAIAEEIIVNPEYAASNKTPFQQTIDNAKALAEAVDGTENVEEVDAMIAALKAAQQAFEEGSATWNNPAAVAITNGIFPKPSNTNNGPAPTGWTVTFHENADGRHRYKDLEPDGFEGYGWQLWRGYTVSPRAKVVQTVTVTTPGLYEYKAAGYGDSDDSRGRGYYAASIIYDEESGAAIDTTFSNSRIFLFMGQVGVPDSVKVHSKFGPSNQYRSSLYSAYFVKTGTEPVEIEFGFEHQVGVYEGYQYSPNFSGFGFSHVNYLGDAAKALTDAKAELAAVVKEANEQKALAEGIENISWLVVKLNRYLNDAANAGDDVKTIGNTILRLKETMARIQPYVEESQGIYNVKGDFSAERKGVYTLGGVRLTNAANLQPGLYIINGKKYVVK